MKHYKPYTAKKLKLPRRIIFFCAVALAIFVFAVILGNVLKHRLESTTIDTSPIPDDTVQESGNSHEDDTAEAEHDESLKSVVAGCISFEGVTDEDGAWSAADKLRGEGYSAVSFVAVDNEGMLTYASPAVQLSSGLAASEKLATMDMLRSAFRCARGAGMRISAVFTVSNAQRDAGLAKELSEAGVEEILVRGFESFTALDNSTVETINEYVKTIKDAAPVAVGVSLSADIFTAAQYSPYIEKIYANAEYLAINMTEADGETVKSLTEKLQGSFNAYMLRCVLEGDDPTADTRISGILSEAGIGAKQYVSAKPLDASAETGNGGEP